MICPMCKKVAIELAPINGHVACGVCRKDIRKGRPIKVYEANRVLEIERLERTLPRGAY